MPVSYNEIGLGGVVSPSLEPNVSWEISDSGGIVSSGSAPIILLSGYTEADLAEAIGNFLESQVALLPPDPLPSVWDGNFATVITWSWTVLPATGTNPPTLAIGIEQSTLSFPAVPLNEQTIINIKLVKDEVEVPFFQNIIDYLVANDNKLEILVEMYKPIE